MDLADADNLVPDALLVAREKAGVPTVVLRGYVGRVGQTLALYAERDADVWTEIPKADVLGAIQAEGDGVSTILVRKDATVRRVSRGPASEFMPATAVGTEDPGKQVVGPHQITKTCVLTYTGEAIWRGTTPLFCKYIKKCTTVVGSHVTDVTYSESWRECPPMPFMGSGSPD